MTSSCDGWMHTDEGRTTPLMHVNHPKPHTTTTLTPPHTLYTEGPLISKNVSAPA